MNHPKQFANPLPFCDSAEWYAMGFTEVPTADGPFWEVAMVFRTDEYGRRAFQAISAWNDKSEGSSNPFQNEDRTNNIGISFISEPTGDYHTYVYPTLQS